MQSGLSETLPVGPPTSSLANLTLGAPTATSTMFPPVSSGLNLTSLGSLSVTPGSPANSLVSSVAASNPGATSQSPLASMFPSILSGAQHPPVGSQLTSLPPTSIISSVGTTANLTTIRSQSVQPAAQPVRSVDIANIFETPTIIQQDVEDEANSYFQRIYNQPPRPTISIEEVLKMLKRFQTSDKKRENDIYACMLRNLFEEYKFFPTYPQRELITTAKLIGGIIEQGLVEFMALGIALRYVMEALQRPHMSKMYYFGVVALDKFRSRLKEYPRYCQHLRAIDHFNEFPPHLQEYIKYGTQSQEPPTHPSGPVLPPNYSMGTNTPPPLVQLPYTEESTEASHHPVIAAAATTTTSKTITVTSSTSTTTTTTVARPQSNPPNPSGKPTIATTNIETLLGATETEEKAPPEHIQDKISFIFNNLSQVNLPQKCDELKELVSDEYWVWVAQYLVMKRASIENNFHTLYSLFIDHLKMNTFNTMVTRETLRNIKVLLRTDKSSANFSDKSLLKNLGHWLGMLTLGKNKPILHIDVDVRSLLIEAYSKGLQEMQYVIPFVAKILESCGKSRVFKPPNPWTLSIMNVLAELHQEQDMKLHLKFEIEVLCNKLEITLDDLKATGILKNAEIIQKIKPQLSVPGGKRAESTPLFPPLTTPFQTSAFVSK